MGLKESRDSYRRSAMRAAREAEVLDDLGDIEGVASAYVSFYPPPTIDFNLATGADAREVALAIQRRVKDLTGTLEHVKKSFSETTGNVTYTILGYKFKDAYFTDLGEMPIVPVTIRLNGGTPTLCKVELVEEPVLVPEKPAVPAHMEVRKRYKITNPEECGAKG